jgi:hypothetical protein
MVACVFVFVLGQVIRVGADYWLTIWSSNLANESQRWYLVGYWIFSFALIPDVFFRSGFPLRAAAGVAKAARRPVLRGGQRSDVVLRRRSLWARHQPLVHPHRCSR